MSEVTRVRGPGVPAALKEDLWFNRDRAALLLRREILDVMEEFRVSPEQWEILSVIGGQEEIHQAALGSLTLRDKGNVSRMVSRLERDKWLHRRAGASGGGRIQLHLTKRGKEVSRALPARIQERVEELLQPLSADERVELLHCIKKLRILLGDKDVI